MRLPFCDASMTWYRNEQWISNVLNLNAKRCVKKFHLQKRNVTTFTLLDDTWRKTLLETLLRASHRICVAAAITGVVDVIDGWIGGAWRSIDNVRCLSSRWSVALVTTAAAILNVWGAESEQVAAVLVVVDVVFEEQLQTQKETSETHCLRHTRWTHRTHLKESRSSK